MLKHLILAISFMFLGACKEGYICLYETKLNNEVIGYETNHQYRYCTSDYSYGSGVQLNYKYTTSSKLFLQSENNHEEKNKVANIIRVNSKNLSKYVIDCNPKKLQDTPNDK